MNFESLYAGYVVKEKLSGYFVGPNSQMYRVKLRSMALRFTKQEALNFIENNTQNNKTTFIIEDAT